MRIAVFTRALAEHSSGGLAIAATGIARCIADAGHEVEVFTTKTDTFSGIHEKHGVCRHFLADTTPCKYEGGYYNAATREWQVRHKANPFIAIVSISKAAMEVLPLPGRPKMLFTSHGIGLDAVQEGINVALISRSHHHASVEAGILKGIRSTYADAAPDIHCTEQEFYLKWDALAGVSHSAAVDLQIRMGHPRVFFLPNPVYDIERSACNPRPASSPLRIGICAGNLMAANKGVVASLPALAALSNVHVHLIGSNGDAVVTRATGRFTAHGKLTHEETLRLLADMDVVLDPSVHHSGLNMVVTESLSLGIPVIAYPFGGMPTAIGHGINGFLIRPGHPADLAEAIEGVRQERPKLAKSAYELADRYTPEVCGQRYSDAIGRMLLGYGHNGHRQ